MPARMHQTETIFIMEPKFFRQDESWSRGAFDLCSTASRPVIELPMLKVDPSQSLHQQKQRMSLDFIINTDSCETPSYQPTTEWPRTQLSSPSCGVGGDGALLSDLCAKKNCYHHVSGLFGDFCEFHKPSRLCKVPECRKCAKTGGYCISHGGGRRCFVDKCIKSAKEGGFCIAHGGGKRCTENGCTKSALAGGHCSAHGGGKRCNASYCSKTALKGGLCIAHGGGRRCEVDGCTKSAVGGQLCVSHGGGRRCREDGCDKGAVRHGVCIRHGARRL